MSAIYHIVQGDRIMGTIHLPEWLRGKVEAAIDAALPIHGETRLCERVDICDTCHTVLGADGRPPIPCPVCTENNDSEVSRYS